MASEAISYEPEAKEEQKKPVVSGGGRPNAYRVRPNEKQRAIGKPGDRVPGVTTITKRFQESGGLIQWAYNCGVEGIDMHRVRDDAGDAGHVAHGWVDDDIHGRPLGAPPRDFTEEMLEGPRNALAAFREWREQMKLEIIATEVPLVSEELRFGGTFDAIFRIKGKLYLGDWKTGNKVYGEHLAQMGGYALLIEESGFLKQFEAEAHELAGVHLLRFDKEFGSFAHYSWPQPVLALGKKAFREMRSLYDVVAKLKGAVG